MSYEFQTDPDFNMYDDDNIPSAVMVPESAAGPSNWDHERTPSSSRVAREYPCPMSVGGMGQDIPRRESGSGGMRVSSCGESNSTVHPGPCCHYPVTCQEAATFYYRPSPAKLDILLDMPPIPKEVQIQHGWNPNDRSLNIYIKEDKLTACRRPAPRCTDCIRGKVGFTKGFHVWEIRWAIGQRGSHAVVGVATADAPLNSLGHKTLVGRNDQSWGWHLGRCTLYHDCKSICGVSYPSSFGHHESSFIPDKFLVVLDMDEGTLSFVINNHYTGVAFRGLKGETLYPIVSAVNEGEITMKYLGGLNPGPLKLKDLCRRLIRLRLGLDRLEEKIQLLNLPADIETYLTSSTKIALKRE